MSTFNDRELVMIPNDWPEGWEDTLDDEVLGVLEQLRTSDSDSIRTLVERAFLREELKGLVINEE